MSEIAIGIIVEIIKAIMHGAYKVWQYRKVKKPIRKFFKKLGKSVIFVLPPADVDPLITGTQISDFLGAMKLQSFLKELSYDVETRRANNLSEKELKEHNLIVVGGPISNKVTKTLFKSKEIIYKFGGPDGHDIIDSKTGKVRYSPIINDEQRVERDYGILTRIKNPYNKNKDAIIASGCFGWGTYASLIIMGDAKLLEYIKNNINFKKNPYFQVIVSTMIDEDKVPLEPEIIQKTLIQLNYQERGDEHEKNEK